MTAMRTAHEPEPDTVTATITRYQIPQRSGAFAWYYGYAVVMDGMHHSFGRFPLASVRRWCREHGATEIVEAW